MRHQNLQSDLETVPSSNHRWRLGKTIEKESSRGPAPAATGEASKQEAEQDFSLEAADRSEDRRDGGGG